MTPKRGRTFVTELRLDLIEIQYTGSFGSS